MRDDSTMSTETGSTSKVSYQRLLSFFIPLCISASLVTISHVIINSTLARSTDPVVVIASYSVAMSLFGIFERCAVILRQTCATLVRDKVSYRLVSNLAIILLSAIFVISLILSYSPLGALFFEKILGVKDEMLKPTLAAYRVLMFVTIFSGLRCLYHGVIITNLRTKWLTIGMVIRLGVMALLSYILLLNGFVTAGYIGAVIFLVGMVVEALVSMVEGRQLIKKLPEKLEDHPIVEKSQVAKFYLPLLAASLIAVSISPGTNAVLGSSGKAQIAIASYAIALSILQLLVSTTSYTHQVVINFFEKDSKRVTKFTTAISLLPTVLLLIIVFTPFGNQLFATVMGVSGELFEQSILALKFFIVYTLCFPWLDFFNGILMIRRQTKVLSFSQAGNVTVTFISLFTLLHLMPNGGGMIGSLSQSLGLFVEAIIALFFVKAPSMTRFKWKRRIRSRKTGV